MTGDRSDTNSHFLRTRARIRKKYDLHPKRVTCHHKPPEGKRPSSMTIEARDRSMTYADVSEGAGASSGWG